MKNLKILSIVLIYFALISTKCDEGGGGNGFESCKNLPNIQFKDEKIGTDKEKTLKLLTDLTAAAKTDAELSKTISAEAALTVKSEFGKKLKQNISASQSVSDDFWEQNITLTQLLCFTESQAKSKEYSKEERAVFTQLLAQIIADRNEYLKQRGLKKK